MTDINDAVPLKTCSRCGRTLVEHLQRRPRHPFIEKPVFTDPTVEPAPAPVQWALRLPPATATRVDARVAGTGLSRNEWLNRVIEWALEQPATTRTVTVKL